MEVKQKEKSGGVVKTFQNRTFLLALWVFFFEQKKERLGGGWGGGGDGWVTSLNMTLFVASAMPLCYFAGSS